MSGHSKWSTIKHKKAITDAKRGKAFTKLIKEITVAAREGGGDPMGNSRLRLLLEKAKEANMPQENATRAIKKGTGELPGVHFEEHTYEGYGPGGIAILVEALTDNKNRTVSALRHLFTKFSSNLGETGAVNWMFEKLGVIKVQEDNLAEDDLIEMLLDFDVKDINLSDSTFFVQCSPKHLDAIKTILKDKEIKIEEAGLEWVPKNTLELNDNESKNAINFLTQLEELEDVQNVYTNLA